MPEKLCTHVLEEIELYSKNQFLESQILLEEHDNDNLEFFRLDSNNNTDNKD